VVSNSLKSIGGIGDDCDVERDDGALFLDCMGRTRSELVGGCACADFNARYFLFVSNSVGSRRISLFAIGERPLSPNARERWGD
jgi:hypothetical protein